MEKAVSLGKKAWEGFMGVSLVPATYLPKFVDIDGIYGEIEYVFTFRNIVFCLLYSVLSFVGIHVLMKKGWLKVNTVLGRAVIIWGLVALRMISMARWFRYVGEVLRNMEDDKGKGLLRVTNWLSVAVGMMGTFSNHHHWVILLLELSVLWLHLARVARSYKWMKKKINAAASVFLGTPLMFWTIHGYIWWFRSGKRYFADLLNPIFEFIAELRKLNKTT